MCCRMPVFVWGHGDINLHPNNVYSVINIGTRRSHETDTIHITTTRLLAVSKAIQLPESADVTSVFFSFFFF